MATASPITPSRRWCCFPPSNRPRSSSSRRVYDGRPVTSTPTLSPEHSGPSNRYQTPTATLSTISTQQQAKTGGWACGRALAVKNNVIVDVNTCSPNPANSAVDIANQIVAKVATR